VSAGGEVLAPFAMIGGSGRHYLSRLFEPESVAVVGASECQGKVGEVLALCARLGFEIIRDLEAAALKRVTLALASRRSIA